MHLKQANLGVDELDVRTCMHTQPTMLNQICSTIFPLISRIVDVKVLHLLLLLVAIIIDILTPGTGLETERAPNSYVITLRVR